MDPGDQVELEVLRDRNERIVRGELESRQEALVLNNRSQGGQYSQQFNDNRQTGYEQSGNYGYQQSGQSRSGDFNSRITSIEQQVNRLSRELEQVRFALQDLRQGNGYRSETQAGYNQYQSGGIQGGYQGEFQSGRAQDGRSFGTSPGNQDNRFQESRFQGSNQSGQINSSGSSRTSNEGGWDSEGGVTGGLRTRPDNDTNWADRQ